MPYATIAHVQARTSPRRFTATSQPAVGDVEAFLEDVAAELDALLLGRGYALPVPATATIALGVLRQANAIGAWALAERAAPTGKPDQAKAAQREWEQWQARLRPGNTTTIELDLPRAQTREGRPRGGVWESTIPEEL